MGQNGRKEFSQQNGAAYGFFNKFLSVANCQTFVYFFVCGTEKILYIFLYLKSLLSSVEWTCYCTHNRFRVTKKLNEFFDPSWLYARRSFISYTCDRVINGVK